MELETLIRLRAELARLSEAGFYAFNTLVHMPEIERRKNQPATPGRAAGVPKSQQPAWSGNTPLELGDYLTEKGPTQ